MRAVLIVAATIAVLVSGCGDTKPVRDKSPLAEKVGEICTVQFHRGAGLGAGGGLPVPPTTGSMNGAEVSVVGRLTAVSDGWIAVQGGDDEYHIRHESILLVHFRR